MMASTPVLGPVALQGFEVPERISLGGKQLLAVHTLPGGGRVVDALGADEAPIRWSGTFSGQKAAECVRTLERLRRVGAALPLSWDGWLYMVVIQEFSADVSSPWWIPYRIELLVLPEGTTSSVADTLVAPTAAEAAALGAGPGIDQRIAVASAGLATNDLAGVVVAAGDLAQLVTARAFAGSKF